jgi:outer membrane autotransporter protein
MGAAAGALIAAVPSLHAATPEAQSSVLQAAVRDALRLPVNERMSVEAVRKAFSAPLSSPPASQKIDFSNGDDITVAADQTALPWSSDQESISLVNTGDLTGGIGIDVSTGTIDLDTALINNDQTSVFDAGFVPLFDDAGARVVDPYGYAAYVSTASFTYHLSSIVLPRDPSDATIEIDNGGSIDFAGRHGIRALNPAGQSIDIVNSGDITSTEDTEFRSGIYAKTEVYEATSSYSQTAVGERTYNAFGQVTGVVAPDEFVMDVSTVDMEYDGGSISIDNSGDIDMGQVAAPPVFGGPSSWASVGIEAIGDGGTTIVNSGDIRVDQWSAGIDVRSTATTDVENSGRIDVGNYSVGIAFSPSRGTAGDYRLGGDVYIVNRGEIHGGVTKDELAPGEVPFVSGMNVVSLGSNNEYLAPYLQLNEVYARYNEALGSEEFPLFDFPNAHLYDTTVVNEGLIELKDGAAGIVIVPRAGDSTAINSGTIIVGDGTSIPESNIANPSAGIFQTNFPVNGLGLTASINTESGIIVAGDDSAGIRNLNIGGDSIAINEGSITIGNGTSTRVTNTGGESYDRLFQSAGITSISAASQVFGTTAYASNSGEITTGNLSFGIFVSGQGQRLLDPTDPTAIAVNEGIITTGDDSSGLFAMGYNATAVNTGSITIGDLDLSQFQPHPVYTADEFAQQGFGVAASGIVLSEVVNGGEITTGNGTIGAAARMYIDGVGYGARLLQGAGGVITTGDGSIGAQVAGNYGATFVNEGKVTVGADSIGVDVSAGSAMLRPGDSVATVVDGALFASNSGIVETGDNSVGIRLTGARQDVAYSGQIVAPPTPEIPYYHYVDIGGTVDIVGVSYLINEGTIRTGEGSTAVEITGKADSTLGAQVFNVGTIRAGANGAGTAISVNAGNDLDSVVVNVGSIAGDIVFGSGDDTLVNTQRVDSFGRVTDTGNITLNGTVIDFGGGSNRFEVDRGRLTIGGGTNLVAGADVIMTDAIIEARNDLANSTLTFGGNLTGNFTFGTDLSGTGADQLVVQGDVAASSAMSFLLNPTEQMRGDIDFTLVSIDGQSEASAPVVAGVSGRFADSVLRAQASYNEATGKVVVSARFGMGHMAVAAASATTMAQNWWLQAVESFDKRNMHTLSGAEDSGFAVWTSAFHEEGTIDPDNQLQDASFDQKVSGLQAGVQWSRELGDGRFSVSPMFSYGDASANPNANLASAKGHVTAYGLNANYKFDKGLYFDATWHSMTMKTDFKTPGTASSATGESDANGDGYSLETGYAYSLKSGLTLVPQVQYASVDVNLDDFQSSDGVYRFTDVGGTASLLRAGVSVFKAFETPNGFITPLASVSYLYGSDGDSVLSSNGIRFANDAAGSGYRAEFGIAGRYKAWDITGRVGVTDTSVSDYTLSTNVAVRYRW